LAAEFGVGYTWAWTAYPVLFVLLSTALTPICILASWEAITARARVHGRLPRARDA
jgi:NADH-quinone oxidoreductase subunit M